MPSPKCSTSSRSLSSTCGICSVFTVTKMICSCSTLLCSRLCSSAGGVREAAPLMKIAVPGTRVMPLRLHVLEEVLERLASPLDALGEDAAPALPRRSCTVKIAPAIASGNQPPCAILMMLAPKKATSMIRKIAHSGAGDPEAPPPALAGHDVEQHRRDHHRRGHRDAVRGGEIARGAEDEHQSGCSQSSAAQLMPAM